MNHWLYEDIHFPLFPLQTHISSTLCHVIRFCINNTSIYMCVRSLCSQLLPTLVITHLFGDTAAQGLPLLFLLSLFLCCQPFLQSDSKLRRT